MHQVLGQREDGDELAKRELATGFLATRIGKEVPVFLCVGHGKAGAVDQLHFASLPGVAITAFGVEATDQRGPSLVQSANIKLGESFAISGRAGRRAGLPCEIRKACTRWTASWQPQSR